MFQLDLRPCFTNQNYEALISRISNTALSQAHDALHSTHVSKFSAPPEAPAWQPEGGELAAAGDVRALRPQDTALRVVGRVLRLRGGGGEWSGAPVEDSRFAWCHRRPEEKSSPRGGIGSSTRGGGGGGGAGGGSRCRGGPGPSSRRRCGGSEGGPGSQRPAPRPVSK